MSTPTVRTKPTTILEGLQRLRPTFLVAEILARFSREISGTEDLDDSLGDLSMDRDSYIPDDRDGSEEHKWQPEGSHPHVLELRAHYIRDQTAIRALEAREEVKEPEVDLSIEIDEIPQPRWRIHDRVPQVGVSQTSINTTASLHIASHWTQKTWSAVLELKKTKALENACP